MQSSKAKRWFHKCRSIVAVSLSVLLVASVGITPAYAAPTQADLAAAQARLESLGSELASIESDLSAKSDALEQTKQNILDKQAEIEETEEKLGEARTVLAGRVSSGYKTGGVNFFEVITQSTSFEDLVSRIYYMNKVNESDEEAIDEVRTLQATLKEEKASLEQQQAEQETALAEAEARQADYQAKVSEAQAYYNSLDAQIQEQLAAEAAAAAAQATTAVANGGNYTNNGLATAVDAGSTRASSGKTGGASGGGLSTAYSMIGVPYVWGGTSASGVDCSGLVVYSYGGARGRTTYQMISSLQSTGSWKTSLSELNAGDLVFTSTGHVGIYVGGGRMIHAPSPGRTVCEAPVYSFIGGGTY